jgi:hypothetical protein
MKERPEAPIVAAYRGRRLFLAVAQQCEQLSGEPENRVGKFGIVTGFRKRVHLSNDFFESKSQTGEILASPISPR